MPDLTDDRLAALIWAAPFLVLALVWIVAEGVRLHAQLARGKRPEDRR